MLYIFSVPARTQPGSGVFLPFSLTYSNLTSPVVQTHIHFGAGRRTNGGVIVFLCGGPKPACPTSGTHRHDYPCRRQYFAGLIAAIFSGDTYVNVHSANFPSGEIRGRVELH